MRLMYSSPVTVSNSVLTTPRTLPVSRWCRGLLAGLATWACGFVPSDAAAGDEQWDGRFGIPFLNGSVAAMVAADDAVYVGGSFTLAGTAVADQGGTTVNGIFLWRDGTVAALGAGLNGAVNAIAVSGSNVYVGGEFTQAGGGDASRVARWDGQSWSPLGGGVSGVVHAIAVQGNDVYVGGNFATAGGVTVNGVARWDGNSWSAIGGGLGASATIRALAFYNGQLHVGGFFFDFKIIEAVPVILSYLAKWDGAAWSPLGSGVNNQVNALLVDGGSLYAGGTLTTAGGVTVNKLGRWNGATWSAVGSGFSTGVTDAVNALARRGDQLYAGGYFTTADEQPVNALARWNGTAWTEVDGGVISSIGGTAFRATVSALAVTGGQLHVGGSFNQAGGREVGNAAIREADAWQGLGMGLTGPAYAAHQTAAGVLVGGMFATAGGVPVNSIAWWDGADWAALGGGVQQNTLPGQVFAIATHGTNTYVAGVFNRAGSVDALNIARWNGSAWFPLGSGIGGFGAVVRALTIGPDGSLYAGGFFTTVGGNAVTHLARWDGANWAAAGTVTANGGQAEVRALATLGNDIYVGGAFNNIGGISTTGIGRWNGSAWSAVGGGMDNTVLALATASGELYAGGYFTTAGGAPAKRIARWNGATWSALGDGIGTAATNFVSALAVDGTQVYAGGLFTTLGDGSPASHIATWNGDAWATLGSGTSAGSPPVVYGLATGGGRLYVAGVFGRAGGKPANAFAVWNGAVAEQVAVNLTLQPNGQRIIRFTAPAGQSFQVWSTTNLATPMAPFSDPIPGTGAESSFEDASPPGAARYYQLRQLP